MAVYLSKMAATMVGTRWWHARILLFSHPGVLGPNVISMWRAALMVRYLPIYVSVFPPCSVITSFGAAGAGRRVGHLLACPRFAVSHLSRRMTKPTKWPLRPAKTQISLGIRPVWSESSLSAWRNIVSSATHWAHCKDWSDWGGCPGWSESSLGAQIIWLVLSWGGSFYYCSSWCHRAAIFDCGTP